MPIEGPIRTSYIKEDCIDFVKKLADTADITPFNIGQLGTTLGSAFRSGEIESELRGNRWYIKNVDGWFTQKVLPNTVEKRWLFDVELLYLVQKNKFSIYEIPVSFRYGYGKIRSSFIFDSLKLFSAIFLIKLRHRSK